MTHTPFARLDPEDYRLPAGLEARLHTPALVVFLPAVRRNLRRMLQLTGGPDRWRPHLKTTKLPAIWRELINVGIRHFKCATVREARHMAELLDQEGIQGADLLVAYPLVAPALDALGRLASAHEGTRFSMLVESKGAIQASSERLGLFIDLNPGMHRTGVPMDQSEHIQALAHAAGARLRGLHYYDGHLHDADQELRRRECFKGYDELLELVRDLEADELRIDELITSGTPAFQQALAYRRFQAADTPKHRVSPGTVVLHDLRSELENPELGLEPAACLLSRVVSHPTATSVTLDAGSKSLAAEVGDPCAMLLEQPGWVPQAPNEEHLPVELGLGAKPERGSSHWLIPLHVCPTVNLAEEVLLVDGEAHRVERVVARGHDLLN